MTRLTAATVRIAVVETAVVEMEAVVIDPNIHKSLDEEHLERLEKNIKAILDQEMALVKNTSFGKQTKEYDNTNLAKQYAKEIMMKVRVRSFGSLNENGRS
jgi:hypothetical protein